MDAEFVKTKTACELYQVSASTLRRWDAEGRIHTIRTPSNQRLYATSLYKDAVDCSPHTHEKQTICYCRVFSKRQQDDLKRQIAFMQTRFPDARIIQDIGSGINWSRSGLKTILELAMSGSLKQLVVAHRDRLCRFAFELLQWILEKNEVKLVVLDSQTCSEESELAQDLLSIIHVFSCRQMGKRRYKKKQKVQDSKKECDRVSKIQVPPDERATGIID